MAKYDRAITVFSPDGHLFQVEYALEAVNRGTLAVGVKGEDCIVLGAEKKSAAKLQDTRTVRKINSLDECVCLACSGLTADARVLIDRARVEAQSFRLTFDERVSVEHIAKYIASVQQRYTQSGGTRPFGISTLLAGFDRSGKPLLFQTDPSGIYSSWKANAIGRSSKAVREYLEKNYSSVSGRSALRLCVKSLMEMVEASGQTIEVTVMEATGPRELTPEEIDEVLKEVEAETKAAEQARGRQAPAGA